MKHGGKISQQSLSTNTHIFILSFCGEQKQVNDIYLSLHTTNKRKGNESEREREGETGVKTERVRGLGACSPVGRGQCKAGRVSVSCQRE